jgi:hypothetical protein
MQGPYHRRMVVCLLRLCITRLSVTLLCCVVFGGVQADASTVHFRLWCCSVCWPRGAHHRDGHAQGHGTLPVLRGGARLCMPGPHAGSAARSTRCRTGLGLWCCEQQRAGAVVFMQFRTWLAPVYATCQLGSRCHHLSSIEFCHVAQRCPAVSVVTRWSCTYLSALLDCMQQDASVTMAMHGGICLSVARLAKPRDSGCATLVGLVHSTKQTWRFATL